LFVWSNLCTNSVTIVTPSSFLAYISQSDGQVGYIRQQIHFASPLVPPLSPLSPSLLPPPASSPTPSPIPSAPQRQQAAAPPPATGPASSQAAPLKARPPSSGGVAVAPPSALARRGGDGQLEIRPSLLGLRPSLAGKPATLPRSYSIPRIPLLRVPGRSLVLLFPHQIEIFVSLCLDSVSFRTVSAWSLVT